MSAFVVESDVAMPGRRNRYPFATMAAGQSFQVVGEDDARKVRNAAYQFAKKANKTANVTKGQDGAVSFSLRKVADEDLGVTDETGAGVLTPVYRLWRD